MNPVASGDNLWPDGLPPLVPCCEEELQTDEDRIRYGLSAISVREEAAPRHLAAACYSDSAAQKLKARNSFRCVHRPEQRRAAGLRRLSPADLRLVLLEVAHPQADRPQPDTVSVESPPGSAREVAAGLRLHRAQLFGAVLAAVDDQAHATRRDCAPQSALEDAAHDLTHDDSPLADEQVQIILRPKIEDDPAETARTRLAD